MIYLIEIKDKNDKTNAMIIIFDELGKLKTPSIPEKRLNNS